MTSGKKPCRKTKQPAPKVRAKSGVSKRMRRSPTALTMEMYKGLCPAQKVEYWNPFCRKLRDLFGFIDVVAICDDKILGVQVTSQSNMSARYKKITTTCEHDARAWMKAGGEIWIHGWSERKGEFFLTKRQVTLADLPKIGRRRRP